jgi:hypothetical protein
LGANGFHVIIAGETSLSGIEPCSAFEAVSTGGDIVVKPVIIAGGKGMRLWPMSRETLPKPFVPLAGGRGTLLQATLRRLAAIEVREMPLVVCNAAHEFLVRDQAAVAVAGKIDLLL